MDAKRSHIFIPSQLVEQIRAVEPAAGAWKDKNHPELKRGSARWVKQIRRESERRRRSG